MGLDAPWHDELPARVDYPRSIARQRPRPANSGDVFADHADIPPPDAARRHNVRPANYEIDRLKTSSTPRGGK